MTDLIAASARVDPRAELDDDVKVGPFTVTGGDPQDVSYQGTPTRASSSATTTSSASV